MVIEGGSIMSFHINITGQVSQIKLSKSKALWPLFETVVNSIQSLEDTYEANKEITIEAIRENVDQNPVKSNVFSADDLMHFNEFIITDNGNGFNTENYNLFLEAYSQLKIKKGCKGIGRFLWLKAFDEVNIDSIYTENGKWYHRHFMFSLSGIKPETDNVVEIKETSCTKKTIIHLKGFKSAYKDDVPFKLESLAKRIIEHCLPYFIMGTCPKIVLKDNLGDTFCLNNYYEKSYKDSLHQDSMTLKNKQYTLYHMLIMELSRNVQSKNTQNLR